MIRKNSYFSAGVLLATMGLPVLAQDAGDNRPPPPGPEDRREDDRGPGPQDRPRRGEEGPGRQDGPRRPASPFEEAGGAPGRMITMGAYLQLVEQFTHLAENQTAAGVAAVLTSGDILRSQGPRAGIDYFEKLLSQETISNPAVINAIHIQLADLYRANHNPEKALEHLSALMSGNGHPLKIPATQPAK